MDTRIIRSLDYALGIEKHNRDEIRLLPRLVRPYVTDWLGGLALNGQVTFLLLCLRCVSPAYSLTIAELSSL